MGRSLAHRLSPACHFLEFLGVNDLARQLGLKKSTVSNWNRPVDPHGHNNSTGGYIPPEHWPAILDIAARAGARHLTIELLRSKPHREVMPVPNRNKERGDRFEYEMVDRLEKLGLPTTRVPMSGSAENDPGDLRITWRRGQGDRLLLGQCKISKKGDGYIRIMHMMEEVSICLLEVNRGLRFAVMRFDLFLPWLDHGASAEAENFCANYPRLSGDFQVLRKAIEGHDVLFFRRDRQQPFAVMRV